MTRHWNDHGHTTPTRLPIQLNIAINNAEKDDTDSLLSKWQLASLMFPAVDLLRSLWQSALMKK